MECKIAEEIWQTRYTNSSVCWMGLWYLDFTKASILVKKKAVEVIPPISKLFTNEKDIDEHFASIH